MTLLFKDGLIQLVDHSSKTISCDLYELLAGGEDDGKAFELANAVVINEKQIVKVTKDEQESQTDTKIRRKMEI